MRLRGLSVENFRALAQGTVLLDDTTFLIGENDCGKSSLLEALGLALQGGSDAPAVEPRHFRRTSPSPDAPVAGELRIALTFVEDRAGDWDPLVPSPLGPLLGEASAPRAIVLEVTSSLEGGTPATTWSLRAPGRPAVDAPEALAFLRAMNPLVWLRGGSLLAVPTGAGNGHGGMTPSVAELVTRIEDSHAALVSGDAPDLRASLAEGFDAARALLGRAAEHMTGEEPGFRRMVTEILGSRHGAVVGGSSPMTFTGSAAEGIGVLSLTAAVLRALPEALPPGAEPIWVIEDPESHLHPMTLASVMRLLAEIKWQKIVTTQSGEVLAAEPLRSVVRLTREGGVLREWRVRPRSLSAEDLRRVAYHLRARRGVAMFARCWLLVEGETEFWVVPELARLAGHDFAREGIVCVEYAQCGLPALIKLARELGIAWHVLADGDEAGQHYIEQARNFVGADDPDRHLTGLRDRDVEHCFWANGYAPVFRKLTNEGQGTPASRVIRKAVDKHSKPLLALELVLAASKPGSPGVPPPLLRLIETCSTLAREAARSSGEKQGRTHRPAPSSGRSANRRRRGRS